MKTIKPGSFKKLAAGIMLACAAGGANAAIVNGSDLFLSVWDATSNTSYTADLGVDLTTFATTYGGINATFNLDSVFTNWAASGDLLVYNIAAFNKTPFAYSTTDGVLFSTPSFSTGIQPNLPGSTLGDINKDQQIIQNRIQDVNTVNTELVGSSSQAYFYSTNNYWGEGQCSNQFQDSTSSAPGNQLLVQYLVTNGAGPITPTYKQNGVFENVENLTGYFSLNATNSTLTWNTTSIAAVPVPAAVWLFLGGLMSMLGLQKRKSRFAA